MEAGAWAERILFRGVVIIPFSITIKTAAERIIMFLTLKKFCFARVEFFFAEFVFVHIN